MNDERLTIRLAHSPDPDDVFMWWPLFEEAGHPAPMDTARFRFEPHRVDIERLNALAPEGRFEITAMSCANYPSVQDRYLLTACGSSMGDGYGPRVVARHPMAIESLREGPVIAIPGERTSAFAALSLCLGRGAFRYVSVPFDQILPALDAGEFDAGLIIHEGQLTFEDHALHLIVDLGQWWRSRTGLPLPLGMNAIRRDLDALGGPGTIAHLARILEQSVRYAMEHREESIRRVLPWARGMGGELAAKFVDLYVNRWTLDFGEQGLAAVRLFLTQTAQIGLTPALGAMEPIAASHTAADSGYAASR